MFTLGPTEEVKEESEEQNVDEKHQHEEPQIVLTGQQVLSCSESGRRFGHKRAHRSGFFFSCLECKRNFESKEHLMDHFRTHSGENCSETTANVFPVRTGAQKTVNMPFTCQQCQKS